MKNKGKLSKRQNGQIIYGGMISYALIIINIMLGLVYTPWILKSIGSSQYGLYTLASSFITLFLMDFGMSAAVTRFVAKYRAEHDEIAINEIFTIIVKLYLGIVAVVSIILFAIYFFIEIIYSNLTMEELVILKKVYIITAFFVTICFPVNVCNGVLNAFEEYIALKISDVLNRIGCVIVTIIALILGGGIYALVFISGFFNLLTFILKIIFVAKKTKVKFCPAYFSGRRLKEIMSFSLWTTLSSIAQQMIFNIMPTILAMTLNTFAITLYGFANVIEGYVFTITDAINGLFLPKISRIVVNNKDASNVLDLMIKVGRINQSIIMLLFIGLVIVGRDFVSLWIGNEYMDLYVCILLITFPYCISSSQQIANSSVIALNKIKYTAVINVFTGVLNLVVAYLVAPTFGIIGVCASICMTFLLRIIFSNIIYVRILKIDIIKFFIDCHIRMMPGFLISFLIAYFLEGCLPTNGLIFGGWLGLIIKATIILCVFVVVMWKCAWNESEKKLIKEICKL